MSMLIRSIIVADQSVVLPVTLVTEPRLAEPDEHRYDTVGNVIDEESVQRQSAICQPVPEPRYTHDEFMARFESELGVLRETAREEGFAQGHAQGLDEGRTQGAAEYGASVRQVTELLASLRGHLNQKIEGVSDIAIEIVYEAVAKILGEQIVQREVIIVMVREIVRRAKERSRLVARLAPRDIEVLNGQSAKLVEGLNIGDIELVADDRVVLGGCLLETPSGNLDGRIEIQLQQLRDALLNARAQGE